MLYVSSAIKFKSNNRFVVAKDERQLQPLQWEGQHTAQWLSALLLSCAMFKAEHEAKQKAW